VLSGELLFFTQSNQGIVTVVNVTSGETVMQKTRLPGISNLYSSPVNAANRIYFTSRDGKTVVLKHSKKLKVLATNKLEDEFNASPAMVGNQLFLRGRKSLYCLENEASKDDLDNKDNKK
jgi:outer membrane protein assembly factor BamB